MSLNDVRYKFYSDQFIVLMRIVLTFAVESLPARDPDNKSKLVRITRISLIFKALAVSRSGHLQL